MKQYIGSFEKVDVGLDNYRINLINPKRNEKDGDFLVNIIDSVLYVYQIVGEKSVFVFAKSGDYQIRVKQIGYEKES